MPDRYRGSDRLENRSQGPCGGGRDIIDTSKAVPECAAADSGVLSDAAVRRRPALAEGTELLGEYQGSGFREPQYLLRRQDGQVIQLPRLLYLLAAALDGQRLDGQRDVDQLTEHVSGEFGRRLTTPQVLFLLDQRLRPAGILAPEPGVPGPPGPARTRSDPLLALRLRVPVVSERLAWVIGGIFRSLFRPPVVWSVLAAFVALDVALLLRGAVGQVFPSALAMIEEPTLVLLIVAILLVSGVFHECGHVAACRYGGARPGTMGFGIYLVWPAMYSTVTDAYRLDRRGRLRTDLGGVYFNLIAISVLILAYLQTGAPWLLITILLMHVETVRQFIPFVRLDGYYILSDLIGVPDLFSRMGPVLKSLLPGRPPHPRVQELKPWVRRVVTLWVVLVIPALVYFLLPFIVLAPKLLPIVWDALLARAPVVAADARAGELAAATVGVLEMFLLILPWAAVTVLIGMLGHQVVRGIRNRRRGAHAGPAVQL